jgi:hypothetical protein
MVIFRLGARVGIFNGNLIIEEELELRMLGVGRIAVVFDLLVLLRHLKTNIFTLVFLSICTIFK